MSTVSTLFSQFYLSLVDRIDYKRTWLSQRKILIDLRRQAISLNQTWCPQSIDRAALGKQENACCSCESEHCAHHNIQKNRVFPVLVYMPQEEADGGFGKGAWEQVEGNTEHVEFCRGGDLI